ncbi:GNAT family N-acetyltransferase [Thalassotalea sp. PS06]|uniref:GNAT family N-acetyltransferase n=1 Tax=Thalassotalea sp. PS06 TaxID=2594005 RepID=UPI001164FF16|nr:GNAT family N-acetyltransferase [Thalassotalea sp. PS06]QDP00488.1 tRNA(Met) cytidine acetyltransferase [Thalassotalea sp. PS06]
MGEPAYQWLQWSAKLQRRLLCIETDDENVSLISTRLADDLSNYFQRQNSAYWELFDSKSDPDSEALNTVNSVFFEASPRAGNPDKFSGFNRSDASSLKPLVSYLQEIQSVDPENPSPGFTVASLTGQQYRSQLGRENRLVMIDARADFNADVFTALAGTVVGGGLLLLFLKPQQLHSSNTLQHLFGGFSSRDCCHHIQLLNNIGTDSNASEDSRAAELLLFGDALKIEANDFPDSKPLGFNPDDSEHAFDAPRSFGATNPAQQQVIEQVVNVALGKRNKPLVITADRGRGKTTALALATIKIITEAERKQLILITAPSPASINTYFKHLKTLEGIEIDGLNARYQQHQIRFIAVDELLRAKPACNLLLVDEAAAIPAPQLMAISQTNHRLVLASTVHGYEGAGRGFTYKFLPFINRLYPQGSHLHLDEPIRWSADDQLEKLLFERFYLNAELPELSNQVADELPDIASKAMHYRWLQGYELLQEPALLSDAFALLVSAHYQTEPSDLALLLDDEQITLGLQFFDVDAKQTSDTRGSQPVLASVCLLVKEGRLSEQLVEDISQGKRRIRGQFTPQSLLTQANVDWAFSYRYGRIVRIAVHPKLQNLGLGNAFLRECKDYADHQQLDFLATSFGVNPQLFHFWQAAGFKVARLGFNKDKASGEHSILLLHGVSTDAKTKAKELQSQWRQDSAIYLSDEYAELSTRLMTMLLCATAELTEETLRQTQIRDSDISVVTRFIDGSRQYSNCKPAIYRLLLALDKADYSYVKNLQGEQESEITPLFVVIAKTLQNWSVAELAKLSGVSGQKALTKVLQQGCQQLLARHEKSSE